MGEVVYIMLGVFPSHDLFLIYNLSWVDLGDQVKFFLSALMGNQAMTTRLVGEHASHYSVVAYKG